MSLHAVVVLSAPWVHTRSKTLKRFVLSLPLSTDWPELTMYVTSDLSAEAYE